jgi:hypothetical protein
MEATHSSGLSPRPLNCSMIVRSTASEVLRLLSSVWMPMFRASRDEHLLHGHQASEWHLLHSGRAERCWRCATADAAFHLIWCNWMGEIGRGSAPFMAVGAQTGAFLCPYLHSLLQGTQEVFPYK